MLWADLAHKLSDQVVIPLNTYQAQFPEMRVSWVAPMSIRVVQSIRWIWRSVMGRLETVPGPIWSRDKTEGGRSKSGSTGQMQLGGWDIWIFSDIFLGQLQTAFSEKPVVKWQDQRVSEESLWQVVAFLRTRLTSGGGSFLYKCYKHKTNKYTNYYYFYLRKRLTRGGGSWSTLTRRDTRCSRCKTTQTEMRQSSSGQRYFV